MGSPCPTSMVPYSLSVSLNKRLRTLLRCPVSVKPCNWLLGEALACSHITGLCFWVSYEAEILLNDLSCRALSKWSGTGWRNSNCPRESRRELEWASGTRIHSVWQLKVLPPDFFRWADSLRCWVGIGNEIVWSSDFGWTGDLFTFRGSIRLWVVDKCTLG